MQRKGKTKKNKNNKENKQTLTNTNHKNYIKKSAFRRKYYC